MKLNIEELAVQAGFKSRNGFIRVQHTNGSFVIVDDELEAFARLIVERCAAICEEEAAGHGSAFGEHCAIMIRRKLLEAK